jgi:hypothetical protein
MAPGAPDARSPAVSQKDLRIRSTLFRLFHQADFISIDQALHSRLTGLSAALLAFHEREVRPGPFVQSPPTFEVTGAKAGSSSLACCTADQDRYGQRPVLEEALNFLLRLGRRDELQLNAAVRSEPRTDCEQLSDAHLAGALRSRGLPDATEADVACRLQG